MNLKIHWKTLNIKAELLICSLKIFLYTYTEKRYSQKFRFLLHNSDPNTDLEKYISGIGYGACFYPITSSI